MMSASGIDRIRIHLFGRFRVENHRGADLTPVAAKAQALLALLASSQDGARTRAFLQSKLWSDRGSEQAAASLRQSLVQIRRVLDDKSDILIATRQKVELDLDRVEIVTSGGEEFLEGLDARDPEFEKWLSEQRQFQTPGGIAATVPAAGAPGLGTDRIDIDWTLAIRTKAVGDDMVTWLLNIFSDGLAQQVREIFSATVVMGDVEVPGPRVWTIALEAVGNTPPHIGVRASLEHQPTGRRFWSGYCHLVTRGAPPVDHPELQKLSNLLIEAIGDTILLGLDFSAESPDALCRSAIRSLFSMTPAGVSDADAAFERAYELSPRGLYLAWRAQVRTIQRVEKHRTDVKELLSEAEYFCSKALEVEPNNSMVLANVANTHGHLMRDHARSLFYAKRAVDLNISNPMAWWALSSANVYTGDLKASYANAVAARNLAVLSPHRFWWDVQLFAAALVKGRLNEALQVAEECATQNKNYRPPLRYMIALYANSGRFEDAVQAAKKLRILEPEFSIENLTQDDEYPASLVHKTPGLDVGRINSLI